MNTSLYLAQSYSDAWEDYQRSLKGRIPTWDFIILTASNEHQAETFRLQVESRASFIPVSTRVVIIPDERGVRIGSGGATLSALKYLDSQGGWVGKRILLIFAWRQWL